MHAFTYYVRELRDYYALSEKLTQKPEKCGFEIVLSTSHHDPRCPRTS